MRPEQTAVLPNLHDDRHREEVANASPWLDAGLTPEPVDEAEQAWLAGARHYQQGLEDYNRESFEAAAGEWEMAARLDPTMADAYAGLAAVRGICGTDDDAVQTLAALAATAGRVGEQQERHGIQVFASYVPLAYSSVVVESADDARRAYVRSLTLAGEFDEARALLGRCDQAHLHSCALAGSLELAAGEFDRALTPLQRVVREDAELRVDARLAIASCLRELEVYGGALHQLEQVQVESDEPKLRLIASYNIGTILLELGETGRARAVLECVYAEDVYFRDVAELIGREPAEQRLRREMEWPMLVDGIANANGEEPALD
jgi:tetratricopeptide (TPR) repeat protein